METSSRALEKMLTPTEEARLRPSGPARESNFSGRHRCGFAREGVKVTRPTLLTEITNAKPYKR